MEEKIISKRNKIGKERFVSLILIATICAAFGFDLIFGKLLWGILILVELPWSLFLMPEWEKYV